MTQKLYFGRVCACVLLYNVHEIIFFVYLKAASDQTISAFSLSIACTCTHLFEHGRPTAFFLLLFLLLVLILSALSGRAG